MPEPIRNAGPEASRREFAIFALSFLLYGLWPSRNHNYADDALRFAVELTNEHGLIVSHHLYLNAMRVLWQSLDRARIPVDPARLLSLYAAFTGALALGFLSRLLRRLGLGAQAGASVLLCAASAGFWSYAIVGDVYVPALAFLIVGTDFAIAALQAEDRRTLVRAAGAAAAAYTLAVFHHQANAVYIAGIGIGILLTSTGSLRKRIGLAVAVPLISGVLSLALYAGAFAMFPEEHRHGFLGFLSGYGSSYAPLPDMKRLSPGTMLNAGAGAIRALVSTNPLFRDARFVHAIQTRFPYRNVYPYSYLVRHIPLFAARCLILLAAISAAITAGLAVLGMVESSRRRSVALAIFPAMLMQALFFTWWEAISDEFWIWALPFIAIAAAAGAARGRGASRALRVAAAGVALTTLLGSIVPCSSEDNDLDAVNDRYLRAATPADLVIGFDEIQSDARTRLELRKQNFHYFNFVVRARTWSRLDSLALADEVSSALARGGRILVDPYVLHPPRSNLAHIALENPAFDARRLEWITRLQALDPRRVVWVPLTADVPGDFL
jgi:hypothetical protein